METLVKSSVLYDYKNAFKVEDIQNQREMLITRLNLYIKEKVNYSKTEDIRNYFLSTDDFRIYYGNSYVFYDRENDLFKLEYIVENKVYKEEIYEYIVRDGYIEYGCIDYSF